MLAPAAGAHSGARVEYERSEVDSLRGDAGNRTHVQRFADPWLYANHPCSEDTK